ncbi:MAG TPA: phosphoribosylglycinamide formyltransferase [bacterium]|nr:phosphoribosylglycinamide formyltransferase [bacterium]
MPNGRAALRVGVLVSGAGTVLQALIDACRSGEAPADIAVVISNVPGAFALERARAAGIPAVTLDHRTFPTRAAFEAVLRTTLEEAKVELICLAGFLRILTPGFVDAFAGRIMNIHPALLPAFGGKGMYGDRVHEAVLASGARLSGCTVHFVTRDADAGPIVVQTSVPVEDGDTAATLSARVRREELRAYPLAVRLFAERRLRVEGNRVRILPYKEANSEAKQAGPARDPGSGAPDGRVRLRTKP